MSYKIAGPKFILRVEDNAFIPTDPANTDYAGYLSWAAAGNAPLPADMPNPNNAVIAQIIALESNPPVSRFVREFMLRTAESLNATTDAHYLQAKALDDQIKLLRSQLK